MSGRVLTRLLAVAAAAAVVVTATVPADARRHDPEKLPETRIRDLHYGDVLFYFFQDDDFEAITRLTAYQHWNYIPHHEAEGQLLLGGLYLSLGMHNEAGERFKTLLTDDVPTGVRNKAWFYLAQVWYARGYLDEAANALRKINGRMSAELEAEREHLFANVLLHQGHFDEAIRLLATSRGASIWSAYARFNLGVALIRKDRIADADPFLTGRRYHGDADAGACGAARSRQSGARVCVSAGEESAEGADRAPADPTQRPLFEQGAAGAGLGGCAVRRL